MNDKTEIKVSKKLLEKMKVIQCEEAALAAAESTHLAAMTLAHKNLNEAKNKWWLEALGGPVENGWVFDVKAGAIKRC